MNQEQLMEIIEIEKKNNNESLVIKHENNYFENNIELLPTWIERLYFLKFILLGLCFFTIFISIFKLLSESMIGIWMFCFSGLGIFTAMLLDEFFNFIFMSNKKHEYKKGFFYNLKRKIRHEYFCNLYVKNNPKYDPAIDLIDINDSKFINDIYTFYENHPYKCGTQENLHFTLRLEKIRTLYNQGVYTEIINLYKEDKIKYEYLHKFNFN